MTWETSSLRVYLNNDFFDTFSMDEKKRIIPTLNNNNGNKWYYHKDESQTLDNIFILSLEEMVGPYFNDSRCLLDNKGKNQRYWFERKDLNNELRKSA